MKKLRSQILSFLYFPIFIFKENQVFNEIDNPSQKVVIIEKELHDIAIDGTENLDLPRVVFIDEKCENPKVVD